MRPKLWFGTQHHAQWVDAPLSGAEMSPEGWGAEGTYLSGGGFVRQSQDSHRQYIFEWSGASSRESAEIMQAYRDGVYSKSRRDLIYFIDPNIYDKNILPKRWAQPGILAPDSGSAVTPLGVVSKVDGPSGLGLPMTGAQVSGHFTSLAQFNATTEPQQGSIWVPVPPGKTLYVLAWTGNPANSESGVYVRGQNLDGSWNPASLVEGIGFIGSGLRGVLVGVVGVFDFYAARAALDLSPSQSPVSYAWTGTPNESTSTRTTAEGTATNLFTNPDMVATAGEVVVWENLIGDTSFDQWNAGQGFDVTVEDKVARIEVVGSVGRFFRSPAGNPECEVVTGTFEIWGEGDSVGKTLTMTPGSGNSDFEISIPDSPTVVGATAENAEGLGKTLGILSSGSNVNPLEIGDIFYIRNSMINPSGVRAPFFFDSSFSPDPDLTPQPRPGGGSQLVGQRVEGITSFGELFGDPGVAIVQSTQWSKSGGVSARIITIKDFSAEEPLAQLFATLISMSPQSSAPSGSVSFWVRQDSEIGEAETIPELGFGGRIVIASFEDYEGTGELIPNGPGEGIVRVFADTPQGEPDDGTAVTLFAGTNLGDSIWLDLVTVTDIENYEGEPFSGNTPGITPEWSPGLGHSGCAFVGNPTWTATSGVNGGQVGYAATLKEVGDWQR